MSGLPAPPRAGFIAGRQSRRMPNPLVVGALLIVLAAIPATLAYLSLGVCGGAYTFVYLGVAALLVAGGLAVMTFFISAAVAFAVFVGLTIAGIVAGHGVCTIV